MPFAQDAGYTPTSFQTIMNSIMDRFNVVFSMSYTPETFIGTNHYKWAYALAQDIYVGEIKTAEIMLKVQDYFAQTNARISRPVVTNPGILDRLTLAGYVVSVKPMIVADAGKIHIAVDVDETKPDYAETKLAINTLLSDTIVGGVVSVGSQVNAIVLDNGQSMDYKFNLPNRIPIKLRLTITISENNQVLVESLDDIVAKLRANIAARYRLGKNFEPQRYYTTADAPWAASVLLEYSTNGGSSWSSAIYDANYNDLLTFGVEDIAVIG